MKVNVPDALAGSDPRIDDHAVPVRGEAELTRELRRHQRQMAQ